MKVFGFQVTRGQFFVDQRCGGLVQQNVLAEHILELFEHFNLGVRDIKTGFLLVRLGSHAHSLRCLRAFIESLSIFVQRLRVGVLFFHCIALILAETPAWCFSLRCRFFAA